MTNWQSRDLRFGSKPVLVAIGSKISLADA